MIDLAIDPAEIINNVFDFLGSPINGQMGLPKGLLVIFILVLWFILVYEGGRGR